MKGIEMGSRDVKIALRRAIAGVKADEAARELERIAKDNGGSLSPETVVDAAKSEASPIHNAFTWDDGKAAESYRRQQAQALIRAVVVITPDSAPRPVYTYVPPSTPKTNGEYLPTEVVINRPDAYMRALSHLQKQVTETVDSAQALRDAAKGSDQPEERILHINLAIEAMQTAKSAIQALH